MRYLFFCFLSLSGTFVHAQWNLVWSDEFSANTLDTSKWVPETGGWGWGNNELQYYTDGNNLSFANGKMTIEAREENFGGNAYTSGKIITKGLFEVRYGKVEARIKIPAGQGLWPAFWMLGSNIDQVSWPQCGEIDVMEHVNFETQIHGTAHWNNNGHVYFGASAATDPTVYHVYTIEWDSTKIDWFLDGSLFYTLDIENNFNSTEEFHLPYYLILNLAVGGNWPGNPNGTTPFPSQMEIDYVRVFKSDEELGVGISETEISALQVYPNPSSGMVTVNSEEPFQLKFYSVQGALVRQEQLSSGKQQLDCTSLDNGVYFIESTHASGQVSTVRWIKQ